MAHSLWSSTSPTSSARLWLPTYFYQYFMVFSLPVFTSKVDLFFEKYLGYLLFLIKVPGGQIWFIDPTVGLTGLDHPNDPLHGYCPLRSLPGLVCCHWPQLHRIRHLHWSGLYILLHTRRDEGSPND